MSYLTRSLPALLALLALTASTPGLWAQKKERHPDHPKVLKEHVPIIQAMDSGIQQEPTPVPWRLYKPENLEAGKKYPLVFVLHGSGRKGDDNLKQMERAFPFWDPKRQAEYPAFVLTPQCSKGQTWSKIESTETRRNSNNPADAEPKPALVAAFNILDETVKNQPVDPNRIYIVGMSMGGFGTWDALLRRPDQFAAAIPICGGGDPAQAAKYKDVPVWVWHGANDTTVPPENSREMVAALKAAGGEPKYSEIKAGHGSWGPALASDEVFAWLFAQKKD